MPSAAMQQVDLEVFRNLFVSIAEEMGAVLRRTSFSANIKERRDYSCAVYDENGRTISSAMETKRLRKTSRSTCCIAAEGITGSDLR